MAEQNEILKVTATALAVYAVNLLKRAEKAEGDLREIDEMLTEAEKKMEAKNA